MYSIDDYIDELIVRVKTAAYVDRKVVSVGGWKPVERRCHDNAVSFCKLDVSFKHVYGFLFNDASELGYVAFIFHSVVECSNGSFIDITPTTARNEYPFIVSNIPDEAYEELMYEYENEGRIEVQV